MNEEIATYNADVMAGRPATKAAPIFGQRLSAVRKARGITQREFADLLGTTREMVDYYERRAINPALDVVRGCAKALKVPVIELLGSEDHENNGRKKRGTGPTGKMRRLFDAASQLPRSQQEKIAAIIEPFIAHHAQR
ncbi:MAG: helix-turn-helix domain-containing protein [Pyrinomonadaceae bacterium]